MDGVHVVLGAGGLGREVADELARNGQRVRLVSRSGRSGGDPAIERVRADATNPAELDAALAGAAVAYQCAQPAYTEWTTEFANLQTGILDAAARAGADLVIADNLYMYGDPDGAAISESSRERPTTAKGRVRKQMADDALAAHRNGRLRVAISRASTYFGPGHDQSSKGIFDNALRGKPMQFIGGVDMPHSYSYLPDAARAMVLLGARETGWGSAWISPVQSALVCREFAARVWSAAGQSGKPRISVMRRGMLRAVGLFVPIVRELPEMLYEYEKPFVVDSSRFERAFGVAPTPSGEAIAATLEAYARTAVVPA
ncbi:MAG: NAD-dependent epimerase/dehydratase family protein [Microbacterium sp.]